MCPHTTSSSFKFFVLFHPEDNIFKFLKSFRFAVFSMQFVASESFSQLESVDKDASMFSTGGIWAYSFISLASDGFWLVFSSPPASASLTDVAFAILAVATVTPVCVLFCLFICFIFLVSTYK